MPLSPHHLRDIERLVRLTKFVRDTLRWLAPSGDQWLHGKVGTRTQPKDAEEHPTFGAELARVDEALRTVEGELRSIASDTDPRLNQLVSVGLTGSALELKQSVLQRLLQRFRISPRRILEWINSFLGSLGTVEQFSKPCDLAKEFKEMLEFVVWSIHRPPKELRPVLDLR